MPENELFEVVDDNDTVIGTAPRSQCHGDPTLVHRAAHVLVFNRSGDLLLQKRAADKLIQPDRWDSSVGGHLEIGESYRQAAVREMREELGVTCEPLTYLFSSRIRNDIESENIETFLAFHEGPFSFEAREISDVRFWTRQEIESSLGQGLFTPNFEDEWRLFLAWSRRYQVSREGVGLCAGDAFPGIFEQLRAEGMHQ